MKLGGKSGGGHRGDSRAERQREQKDGFDPNMTWIYEISKLK